MIDDFLTLQAHDRIEAMQREAHVYRLMIDRANLSFGPALSTRLRRMATRCLLELARRTVPCGDVLQFHFHAE